MKRIELNGNMTTMNLNNIVYTNILSSPYYKVLVDYTSYHEIIDEIYNQVSYLEPFATGSAPSSAYCLLYKLWNIKLTNKQLISMLDNSDSPYIRAIGFLYLRYGTKPAQLYEWFEPYLEDEETLNLTKGPRATQTTIGELCQSLLKELKFCNTMLPRIPIPIQKEIDAKLAQLKPSKSIVNRYENGDGGDKDRARSRDDRRDRSPYRRNDDRKSTRSDKESSRRYYSPSPDRHYHRDRDRGGRRAYRDYDAEYTRDYDKYRDSKSKDRKYHSKSRSRSSSRSRSKGYSGGLKDDFGRDMPRN